MRFEMLDLQIELAGTTTIRRLSALCIPWRVLVEAHRGATVWTGRLVFEPQAQGTRHAARYGPFMLRGGSHAELLDAAHALSERRLLELFHSLG